MNLYQQLEVEQTASPQDIKRAYFRLVKQFTPEKAPEVFIRLRDAYETLYDQTKRAAYDASLSRFADTSGEVAAVIMEAERLGEKNLYGDAVALLEQSGHFAHDDVQAALCELYLDMDKPGKAVKIVEALMNDNPDNPRYLRLAMDAYMSRGWANKAYACKEKLDVLDPGNEDNSLILLAEGADMPPLILGAVVEQAEKHGKKAPLFCVKALSGSLCYETDDEELGEQLSLLGDVVVKAGGNPWDDPLFAAKKLAEHTEGIANDKQKTIHAMLRKDIFPSIFQEDRYDVLPFIEQTVKNISGEELFQLSGYKALSTGYTALKAVQAGIPKALAALSLMCAWSESELFDDRQIKMYQDDLLTWEMEILSRRELFIPHIQRFQAGFPGLFQYAASFLDMICHSGSHKIENEINRRIPRAMKLNSRLTLDFLGRDDDYDIPSERSEPVRVTKVGRNEPCPCGSGKKYKKCCSR